MRRGARPAAGRRFHPSGAGRDLFRRHRPGPGKKLVGAARAWASGGLDVGAGPSEAELDAARFGLDAGAGEAIRQRLAAIDGTAGFDGVWPQNAAIVAAFLAAASQWRCVVVPAREGVRLHRTGLDYAGARAGIEAEGITVTPELWRGLRIMEQAAMAAANGETAWSE